MAMASCTNGDMGIAVSCIKINFDANKDLAISLVAQVP
jgi:hypothetical protein